ncbi:YbjQ family protein [Rhizobium terrae]|uniref:YbjQ family protein n=1 Tax=Rhizobium terrae TaxID=2171756 RepID=UPI000E3B5C21|nr:YbjQ family protein [Rhizobium terrae]
MPACASCGRDVSFLDLRGGQCQDCRAQAESGRVASAIKEIETVPTPEELNDPAVLALIVTTTSEIPNRQIDGIIDIVGAETAVGLNIFKDIANNFRDFFGGRSKTVQTAVREARTACMAELRLAAVKLGADAVIGVRFDFSELSTAGSGGILFVAATGTAVKLAK